MGTQIIDVSKYYNHFKALDAINLTIEDGEFVAILGPSGCGKTTLLRLIAGFDSPSAGKILFNNKLMSDSKKCIPPEKRNIGMVFQSLALWPHMTVRQHLKFPLQNHRYASRELKDSMEKEMDKILKITGLEHLSDRFPNQLSGGQRQRVALARSIIAQPSLLIMDEPLSALDAELRTEMRREIQNIHQVTNTSIVYVTHDQSEALAMADKMIIMKDGKIEQMGTPQDVYTKPETEFIATFVSKANIVRGKWEKNAFHLKANGTSYKWQDIGISEELKNNNIFPVRPNQLTLSKKPLGIPGVIKNVQFQGNETHYSIQVEGNLWHIHANFVENLSVGDEAYVEAPHLQI